MKYLLTLLFILILITAMRSQDQTAVAQKGDGIHKLLNRNDRSGTEMYSRFLELNKNLLKGKDFLIEGETYILPNKSTDQSKKVGTFSIFGKKYQDVYSKGNELKGAIFYIVAGHGGPDPGAQGKRNGYTLNEDEYAYDISLRLVRELISHGATAYMITRDENDGIRDDAYLPNDKEETIWKSQKIPSNTNKKLRQRARAVNKLYKKNKGRYQRLIVIHIDSRYEKQRVDIFAYYNSKSKNGKVFTANLINTVEKKYKKYQPARGFSGITRSRDNLYMLKYTHPVTGFLELGNIKNDLDQIRFIKYQNRQAIADWLTDGCIIDYKMSKK